MGKSQTKKLIALGVVAAVLLAGAGGAYVYRKHQIATTAQRNYERGMAAYEAKDYSNALRPLSAYVSRNREDGDAMFALAETRRNVPAAEGAHIAAAVQFAQRARALMPSDPRPVELLLELNLFQSRGVAEPKWTEVLALADRLTELEADSDAASDARIEANLALGRNDVALEEAEQRAGADDASFADAERLLKALTQAGAPQERVETLLDELGEQYPDRMSITLFRVQQAAGRGDLDDARDLAAAARQQRFVSVDDAISLSRFTDMFPPQLVDAGVVSDRDLYAASAALLERALSELDGEVSVDELARLRTFAALRGWRIGSGDAMEWLDPLMELELPPEDAVAVASVLDQWRDPPRGYGDRLQSIAQSSPGLAPWNDLYEASRMLRGDSPEATLTRLRGVPDGGPIGGMARYLRATAMLGLNRPGDARAQLEPLIFERDPFEAVTWRRAAIMLAELYIAAGEPDRAAELLAGAPPFRATSPGTELYAEALVSALELGRVEDVALAMDVFEQIAAGAEARPLVWAWLARARSATGDVDGARAAAERLLEINLLDGVKPYVSVADRLPESLAEMSETLLRRAAQLAMASDTPVPTGDLLLLGDRLASVDRALSSQVLALNQGQLSARAALSKAVVMQRAGDAEGAMSLLNGLIASAGDGQRVEYERAKSAYLVEIGDESAAASLLDVASRYPDDAQAQVDALGSPLLQDRSVEELAPVVVRLREASEESDTRWRVFDARLRLRGEPSDQQLSTLVLSLADHVRAVPGDAQGLLLLAEARHRLGDDQGSIAALENAIEAGAAPGVQNLLVRRLIAAGRSADADRRLVEFAAQPIEPGPALAERATLLESRGYVDLALVDRGRLAETGDVAATAAKLAATARAAGSEAERLEAVEQLRSLASDPELGSVELDAVARALFSLNESESAVEILGRLPAVSDFGVQGEIIASYLMTLGRFDDAIERIDSVPAGDRSLAGWMMLARADIARGQVDRATQTLATAIERFPDHAGLRQVRDTLVAGRSDDSLKDLAGLVPLLSAEVSGPAFEQLDRAASAYVSGDLGRAAFLDRLEDATDADPGLFTVWRMRVIGERAERGIDAAIAVARSAAEAVPIDPRPQLIVASLLFEAGRYSEAIPAYRRWMELEPARELEGVAAIALAELARGRPEAALNEIQPVRSEIERSGSDNQVALLVQALAVTNRPGQAREVIGDRPKAQPLWWGEMLRIASLMPQASIDARRSWVVEVTERADNQNGREVDPAQLAIAWYELAIVSETAEDLAEAQRRLEAEASRARDTTTFLRLAVVRELSGDVASSEQAYRSALELEPANPIALNNLAFLLHTQPGRAREAVELAARAVAVEPGVVSFVDTLGRSQLAAGDAEASLATFSAGLEDAADDPGLILGRVESLQALDRVEDAARALRLLDARRDLSDEQQDRAERARAALQRP